MELDQQVRNGDAATDWCSDRNETKSNVKPTASV